MFVTSADRPLTLIAAQTSGTAASEAFTPTAVGKYHWRASYSGDENNPPVPGEFRRRERADGVAPPKPTIDTQATQAVLLGDGALSDVATVSGLVNPVTGAGAGTVTFRSTGPNDEDVRT